MRESQDWPPGLVRGAAAGMGASLVGIGLSRFAYTPLIPVLIEAGWFRPGAAAYLGAANLAGYLAGALLAAPMARFVAAPWVLRAMMAVVGIAFLACARPAPFAWFFVWRFAAGLAGGTIMALAAPSVLAQCPPRLRGRVSGLILTGVGLGIAAAGTLVPLLLRQGLPTAWMGLGALSLLLTALCWPAWPPPPPVTSAAPARRSGAAWVLIMQYGLCAVGLVPHMVFLVDYVARGLGRGLAEGSVFFLIYGAGGVAGPLAAGWVCDRLGFRRTLRWALPVLTAAVGLPLVSTHAAVIALSCLVVGAYTPGTVSIVLGRAQEIARGDPLVHRAIWGTATASFALFQALAAYGMAWLFIRTGGAYAPLFIAAVAVLAVAAAMSALPAARR